jgi:hypothetical protein
MIEQHSYWRRDLIGFARALERRYRQKRWSNLTRYNIEKEVFLSFYIIRKLIENNRLKSSVVTSCHTVTWYPIIIGATPTTDQKKLAFTYLLFHGWLEDWTPREISNQFIHSLIFSPFRIPRGDMLGIFFASDCASQTGLYYIKLITVIDIILSAARNRPIRRTLVENADGTFRVK